MTERTQSTPTTENLSLRKTRRLTFILAGTAGMILFAGVMAQFLRAKHGQAEEAAGRASVSSGTQQSSNSGQKPLAMVNNELIAYDEVAQECVARYGKEVLENIINRTIILHACQERGIKITGEEVHREVQTIAKKFNLEADVWYKMLETERGISPHQYQRDIIWPMLALRKLAGQEVSVTEQEIQQAFSRDYGERVKAKMIMLDRLDKATKVWEEAVAHPEEFGRLAKNHSIDPNSRVLEGQIPPIRRYAGPEKLWTTAFKLQEGEISAIIEVGLRQYVILQCEGHTKPIVTDIESVRQELVERLHEEKQQERIASIFQQLKDRSTITNYLTNERKEGIQQASGTSRGQEGDGYTKSLRSSAPERPVPNRTAGGQPQSGTRQR